MPVASPVRPAPRQDPLAALNGPQREAVLHDCRTQALLILAGAGSGKTTTLAARLAHLVQRGADPQRILLLSFSRRAAHELAQRAGRLLHQALGLCAQQAAPLLPWAGTFHGIGARLLRDYAPRIGLAQEFSIHDRGDSEELMALVRHELGHGRSAQRFPLAGTCLAIHSRVLNAQQPLAEVLRQHFPWCAAWQAELRALFQAYMLEKQRQRVLDFDDLLLYWWQLLQHPALGAELAQRFTHVLVDEYQDTNRLQAALLAMLKPGGAGLTVVGDDAQAIYAFRGAEVRNILGFAAQCQPPARQLTLAQNYRSTPQVLAAANALIAQAREGFGKQLWSARADGPVPQLVSVDDEAAQARWVADAVLQRREEGLALKQQAVLFRTSHHSAALELELARRNIPFVKFGGLKFLEVAHVKDLLSVLRFAGNPRHQLAGFRAARLVAGLGAASARRLLAAVESSTDPRAAIEAFQPPAAAKQPWRDFAALLAQLQAQAQPWPAELQAALQWYRPQLERLHEDAAVRLLDLEQLLHLAAGSRNREQFLADLTLDPPEATSDEAGPPLRDEDYLVLSTLHSSKGQEWQAVQILNVVDGCMPADLATGDAAQIEEERRLLYVGMTRARTHLQLLVPLRFHVTQQRRLGDRHLYGGLSRFIAPDVAACFERVGAQGAPETSTSAAVGPCTDLPSQLRGLWD